MGYYTGKVVVITGAGSGMGRAYAEEFANEGAKLALMDFDENGLKETVHRLQGKVAGGDENVYSEVFDVSKKTAMDKFAANVLKHFGTADVIINNAGISGDGEPTWATPIKTYERVMGVNFYGVVYGTKAFLPELLKKGSGHIINVSSIFGLVGTPSNSDYCATKFAVRGFTESLMSELADTHIGVHLVHPGGIATNIASGEEFEEFRKKYLTTSPADIAAVVRRAVAKGNAKVVYGNGSLKTWLGSNLVPTKLLSKIVWGDMKKTLRADEYSKANIKV